MKPASIAALFACLAAFSLSSVAQTSQDGLHAPSGNTQMRVESIAVPSMTNAPFTATVSTTWVRKLEDGSTVTIQNQRTIARDNAGRVYQQRRNLYAQGDSRQTEIRQVEISDPETKEIYYCRPAARNCELHDYFPRTAPAPETPAGPLNDGKAFLTREPLGNDTISGVAAIGTRETTTISAGAFGNDQAVSIVKEFWFSPQLGINVIEKRQDPRAGTQTFVVSDISLGEPDRTLFETPADFRIIDLRAPKRIPEPNPGSN